MMQNNGRIIPDHLNISMKTLWKSDMYGKHILDVDVMFAES